MKKRSARRIVSILMVMVMVVMLIPVLALPAAAETVTYTLDATNDLAAIAQGDKAVGDFEKAGTEDYFTIHYSEKTKIDSSGKTFDDGYVASQRINMGGSTSFVDPIKNAIEFTTDSKVTLKIWWVSGGDGRAVQIADADGTVVFTSADEGVKNSLYISTFELEEAGKYYIGSTLGSNYYFRVLVHESSGAAPEEPERAAWAGVAAPEIIDAVDNGEGDIVVTVNMLVGFDGADEVKVVMYKDGVEIANKRSIAEKSEHTLTFENVSASGTYTFKAFASREDETEIKENTAYIPCDFVYPLGAPAILSVTSKGQGKVEIIWVAVKEATSYNVYVGETMVGSTDDLIYVADGLTVGETYNVTVEAVRGTETKKNGTGINVLVTEDAKQTWGFTVYGPSTNTANNGYIGSVNEEGKVTVYSEGGKGKLVPASNEDGIAFYYTAIPTEYNFTLRAKVTVDSWTYSNGQEGFGLIVTDRLGVSGDSSAFWNNSYMAAATKVEYKYDYDVESDNSWDGVLNVNAEIGTKYSMKLGIGSFEKKGVTPENLNELINGGTTAVTKYFFATHNTLEHIASQRTTDGGTFNIIGNATKAVNGSIDDALVTELVLEIQKNNTGYFISYYKTDGTLVAMHKYYGADNLSKLDTENVYAGFFAARNARATFSDIELTTILASEDEPAEKAPVTLVTPNITIGSADSTTSPDYTLILDANVSGKVTIKINNVVVATDVEIKMAERITQAIEMARLGNNRIEVEFTPDPDQDLGENTALANTNKVYKEIVVDYNKGFYHSKSIYVSTTGLPNGTGSKEYPLDIYTAIKNVVPGQTIIIMEGTYKLRETIKIQRGVDGTETDLIYMIADPEATTRPVFDFQGLCPGIVHGGDYWYFEGFDVTNSEATQKGFQVSGNYNVLDNIHAYYNGNTGIQISRFSSSDVTIDQWPAYNLVLNCTSYGNADPGYEDADGFAAKLTVGPGNVFDGCIAYNNADDGWDLYAKVETGPIGSVVIKNCVAYLNGYLEDGTNAGNGNGFKMGGSSIAGKHQLINSYAFFNKQKGIDSNSCPDIIVENCISYNNGKYNVAFYTNNANETDFVGTGIISFKDASITEWVKDIADALTTGEQLKGKGAQATDTSKFVNATNYYWDGTKSLNTEGVEVTADMFVSLVFTRDTITRNADGTINMNGFLELKDTAPDNAGTTGDSTASPEIEIPEDLEHNFSDKWTTTDNLIHWHECECGFKTDIGNHTLVEVIDVEPTATTPGQKHNECSVCGYKRPTIEIPALGVPEEPEQPEEPETPEDPETPETPGSIQEVLGCATSKIQELIGTLLPAAFAIVLVAISKKKFFK